MNTQQLISAIIRQSMLLVARLSTASGVRAPLMHIADQGFRELAEQLERQGVRQKVAADMFGLALRSYQKKLLRLRENPPQRDGTLWETVLAYISEHGPVAHNQVLHRTRYEEERNVRAVLQDLTKTRLIHTDGKGDARRYTVNTAFDFQHMEGQAALEGARDFVWLTIARRGPVTEPELIDQLPYERATVRDALCELERTGRIQTEVNANGEHRYRSSRCLVPVGSDHGWETAVFDHYQAMTLAIASKLDQAQRRSEKQDHIGGATLCFDLTDGHPLEQEVLSLLAQVRRQVGELWERVETHNREQRITAMKEHSTSQRGRSASTSNEQTQHSTKRVWFYFGQNLEYLGDGEQDA